ncbi:hypothetical protein ACFLR4_00975 [Bacteroidota bacterium]
MTRSNLVLVLGTISIFSVVNLNISNRLVESSETSYSFYEQSCARNIAHSIIQMNLLEIAEDSEYRIASEATKNLLGGSASYTVTDGEGINSEYIKIDVTARYPDDQNDPEFYQTKHIIAYAVVTSGWVPTVVRGAWTANGDLNQTISDMYIDGRDHDLDLNIIPNAGKPGISSSIEFRNEDNAKIGGTGPDGTDYPMTCPEDSNAIEEYYNWGGTFPQTPDGILGYPEGTLEALAKSGQNGSQYLENPEIVNLGGSKSAIGGLTYPVSGVTYIFVDNGVEYEMMFEQNDNSGILVIHGPNRSSRIKGVKFNPDNSDGKFTGLLVTDYSFHHHIDILGGVLQLSPNLELDKSCNGNQDHWVYYSSKAIEDATRITVEASGLEGNNKNIYGFATGRVKVPKIYE